MVRIRLLPGSTAPDQLWAHDDVMWGIPRRHGYSDIEDPRAHSGIAQHAFPIGRNERAICGNEPPKRSTWLNPIPLPQLALASPRYNPRCSDCNKLLVGISQHTRPTLDLHPPHAIPVEADPQFVAIPLPGRATPWTAEPWSVEPDPHRVAIPLPGPATPWIAKPLSVEASQTQKRKSTRRSVRRGGTTMVAPGEPLVEIHAPEAIAGAGIVASVVHGPLGVRVISVTVHDDGRATIALNQAPTSHVKVAWFIVSPTEPQVVGVQR